MASASPSPHSRHDRACARSRAAASARRSPPEASRRVSTRSRIRLHRAHARQPHPLAGHPGERAHRVEVETDMGAGHALCHRVTPSRPASARAAWCATSSSSCPATGVPADRRRTSVCAMRTSRACSSRSASCRSLPVAPRRCSQADDSSSRFSGRTLAHSTPARLPPAVSGPGEVEVLVLVARGGASSRAATALFAVQHGLLPEERMTPSR
jgi:hypothetical protein